MISLVYDRRVVAGDLLGLPRRRIRFRHGRRYGKGIDGIHLFRYLGCISVYLYIQIVGKALHVKVAVEQLHAVKFRGFGHSGDLLLKLFHLLLNGGSVLIGQGTVGGFDGQLIDPLKHFTDLCHGAVRDLDNGNSVAGILICHGQPRQLGIHPLGHGQPRWIILGVVDLQAGRKSLQRLRQKAVVICQCIIGQHSRHVVINPHNLFLLAGLSPEIPWPRGTVPRCRRRYLLLSWCDLWQPRHLW